MPSTCPRVHMVNGIQYVYDTEREKFLSVAKLYLRAGIRFPSVSNRMMRLEDGQPTSSVGDLLLRDATITGVTANCESAADWYLRIYQRGVPAEIMSLHINSALEASDLALNVDVSAGDILLFKVDGVGIPYPRALLELAWRL